MATWSAGADYNPYGGRTATGAASSIGYTGGWTDPLTGYLYLRARDYDPVTGQFLMRDPVENLTADAYAYANGNPLQNVDPLGLISIPWGSIGSDLWSGVKGVGQGIGDLAYSVSPWGLHDTIGSLPAAYREGGIGLAVNQFNPVYGLLVNASNGWDLAQQGCIQQSARAFTGATFNAAATVAVAAAGSGLVSDAMAPKGANNLMPGLPSSAPKPLGLGSTGRTIPANLTEQLAMTEVRSAPGGQALARVAMTDLRWPASDGWVKMQQIVNGVNIHYVRNTITGAVDDFKFAG